MYLTTSPSHFRRFSTTAISIINTAAFGASTNYTIDTAPRNWEGVIIDTLQWQLKTIIGLFVEI